MLYTCGRNGKKLELLKAENAGLQSKTKAQKKKEERLEQVLKQDSFELQKSKMSATICVSSSHSSFSSFLLHCCFVFCSPNTSPNLSLSLLSHSFTGLGRAAYSLYYDQQVLQWSNCSQASF